MRRIMLFTTSTSIFFSFLWLLERIFQFSMRVRLSQVIDKPKSARFHLMRRIRSKCDGEIKKRRASFADHAKIAGQKKLTNCLPLAMLMAGVACGINEHHRWVLCAIKHFWTPCSFVQISNSAVAFLRISIFVVFSGCRDASSTYHIDVNASGLSRYSSAACTKRTFCEVVAACDVRLAMRRSTRHASPLLLDTSICFVLWGSFFFATNDWFVYCHRNATSMPLELFIAILLWGRRLAMN